MKPSLFLAVAATILMGVCGIEEINVDVRASFLSKKITGAKRALYLFKDMVFGAKAARPPKKFQLALVGFGRTGTTSFHSSLKKLGFTPVHDDEAMEVVDLYAALVRDDRSTDEIVAAMGTRGFDSAFIMTHKFVEWAASAPDVKVILTVRDKTKWAKSWLSVAPASYLLEQRPFCWIEAMRLLQDFNTFRFCFATYSSSSLPYLVFFFHSSPSLKLTLVA